MKVGLVQMSMSSDVAANRSRAAEGVREAAGRGARVVCLPELFASRYFCQSEDAAAFDLAEPIPGPTTETLGALAAELGVGIVAPIFERRSAGVYHNSAAYVGPDAARGDETAWLAKAWFSREPDLLWTDGVSSRPPFERLCAPWWGLVPVAGSRGYQLNFSVGESESALLLARYDGPWSLYLDRVELYRLQGF